MNFSVVAAQQIDLYVSVSKGGKEKSALSGFELVVSRHSPPGNWTAELPQCPGEQLAGSWQ